MEEADVPVLHTHALSKSYNGLMVLKPLDLQVPRHSIFGFLGPNGAGKTTTIKLLLGLARPTSGSGTIFQHDIVRDSLDIRQRVGYLAQNPRFYDHQTARETLRFTASFFYTGPRAAIEEHIEETLQLIGLADRADRPIKDFSGGERQRLGIGQAQINSPDLLILDEPTASLDPMGRRDVLEVMQSLRSHTTIFYSTHILDDVQRVSDTVAILNQGELVLQSPVQNLLTGYGTTQFSIKMRGDTRKVYADVRSQEWVSSISVETQDKDTIWQVSVSAEDMAQVYLPRLILADEQIVLMEFGRKKHNLEEIFMHLVEGEKYEHS